MLITLPLQSTYKKIGEGVKSVVFDIGDNLVLKQLKNSKKYNYIREYKILKKLESFDVSPKPIFFYKDLLIVEKINGTTITDYVKYNSISTEMCKEIFNSIIFLIKNKIVYSDLHSENVMITTDNKLKFVDIDSFSFKNSNYYIPPFYFTIYNNLSTDNQFNNLTYEEFIQDFFSYCINHHITPSDIFEDFQLYM